MSRQQGGTTAEASTSGTQRAVPMISYEDVGAAADWLRRAFGFRERGSRYADDEGHVTHVELEREGAIVTLGWPGPEYQNPLTHAATCEAARRWSSPPFVVDGVLVSVDDVDAHAERARAAGATIVRPPEDQDYGRLYVAGDLAGHRWMFIQAFSE